MSKTIDISAIEKSLETGLNTTLFEIYIPSLKKKLPFKPLLTGQCKTLAKILISSEGQPLDTFKAVCGMIKATCLEEIDINELTELDRMKIMIEFYSCNNILGDFDIECPKCKTKNRITIDFDRIIEKINSMDTDDILFGNGQDNLFTCMISIPKLPVMYQFFELLQNGKLEQDDILKCFIKGFKLEFENPEVEPLDYNIEDGEDLKEYFDVISMIPLVLMTGEDRKTIYEIILARLDSAMTDNIIEHACTECGEDFGGFASAQNFI